MYSLEAQARHERAAALEKEREEVGLALRDTRRRVKKYDRLKKRIKTKNVSDKKLKRHLETSEAQSLAAARKAARSELLLQEEPGYLEAEGTEKTFRFKQEDIAAAVPVTNSQQYFDLNLDTFGPYSISYSRHGRSILVGGHRGHIATFDWRTKKLGCEFHVRETVRDVQYLHNEMMFAVAQKRHVFVYDHSGMELHCLKKHRDVNKLTFLPYHFLLVSANDHGNLRYLDTSIGREVVEHRTRMGSLRSIAQNPHNAVIHLGHQNGQVTLWSPNMKEPLVKMLCHRGPVTGIAVDAGGWSMATVAMDARLKIWDIRTTYKELHSYYTYRPAVSLSVSQRGLLALGRGRVVEVWRDTMGRVGGANDNDEEEMEGVGVALMRGRGGAPAAGGGEKQRAPYLMHRLRGEANVVEFCPFEDCLGIGHSGGFTSIIVPGAGEANFDALEVNPYQTKKQRQESEVKQLLEKIPAELISLNPNQINKVIRGSHGAAPTNNKDGGGEDSSEEEGEEGAEAKKLKLKKRKKRTRGKSALTKRLQSQQKTRDEETRELKRKQVHESREKGGDKEPHLELELDSEEEEEGREGEGEGEESERNEVDGESDDGDDLEEARRLQRRANKRKRRREKDKLKPPPALDSRDILDRFR